MYKFSGELFPCGITDSGREGNIGIQTKLCKIIILNPNPIGGGGAFMAPPVIFSAVHLDRLEFRVQTS